MILLCAGLFFVFLAHSTLLHYLAEEAKGHPIPVRAIRYPWPTKGRVACMFALVVGLVLAVLGTLMLLSGRTWPQTPGGWIVCLVLGLLPWLAYAVFVRRRLTGAAPGYEGVRMFLPRPLNPKRYRQIVVLAVLAHVAGFLSNCAG